MSNLDDRLFAARLRTLAATCADPGNDIEERRDRIVVALREAAGIIDRFTKPIVTDRNQET